MVVPLNIVLQQHIASMLVSNIYPVPVHILCLLTDAKDMKEHNFWQLE